MAEHRASTLPAFAVALLLLAAVMQEGGPPAPQLIAVEALAGPVAAIVARVIDGDTIEVRAAIWLGQTLIVRVRIDGVDAPELESRCPEERKLALTARDFLAGRLEGAPVKLTRVVYDKYGGRVRADVTDATGDIGQALLAAGLARPYHGERRETWCAPK
jgi:endonuclease YncB( thermonuclease family)